ncbi:hypothetical protein V4890_23860 [Ralstonia solanacearum species complex bacterium KE056]|uniref:hypothetical protein n=1 Tax=Ralstonia solanacearum species complex bacterium KE056 TaxID=3119585 RepID=UPI002FC2FE56
MTREVSPTGELRGETITPFLKGVVGKPAPPVQAVQALLDAQKIKSADVGGPIDKPISADYFIIHDTSAPNCSEKKVCDTFGEFPRNRDDESWRYNKNFLGHPKPPPKRLAHTMINRVGASITEGDFADTVVSTKFESCVEAAAKTTLFVGVENIQPRVSDPKFQKPGGKINDYRAPTPGFTTKQYERLALLYLVASARRGEWLIPIFHGVLDQFYVQGHNDPQNFDMSAFSAAVQGHYKVITAVAPSPKASFPGSRATGDGQKRVIAAFDTAACRTIAATAGSLRREQTSKTTQYFTALFPSVVSVGDRNEDRISCLNMEGYCIVGNVLYNKEGEHFDRDKVKFIFGQGNGGEYNKTNALIPCRTLAADQGRGYYPSGTVIYITSLYRSRQ